MKPASSSGAGVLREREPQRRVSFEIVPDLRVDGDPRLLRIVLEKLQEERTWTCSQLIEAIQEAFAITVGKPCGSASCTWGTGNARADPEVLRKHQASLESLERGE